MGLRGKFFWLDANDNVQPMTLARYERIFQHRIAAPEFAGQVLRLITVVVIMEGRRVSEITNTRGSLVSFAKDGRPDKSTAEAASAGPHCLCSTL